MRVAGKGVTFAHPVERLSWEEADAGLRRLGLDLPTEAQWEYGCRGGSETPWWTGAERDWLEGVVNIVDQTAARSGARWPEISQWPELDDGYGATAPVDRYEPNAFGLHNVHGNVFEWCRDWAASYELPVVAGDPEGRRANERFEHKVYRGGAYLSSAQTCRTARRNIVSPKYESNALGVRPSRRIEGRQSIRR